jgi:hypothetical protein
MVMSYMDTSSDVAHAIVVTSYMDMSWDIAYVIVVTSYMDMASADCCGTCYCGDVIYGL